MDKRIFVKKKEGFTIESQSMLHTLKEQLGIEALKGLDIYNSYDIFNASEEDIRLLKQEVLSEIVTDEVYDDIDLSNTPYIAFENLPGQYDQRADSAQQCLSLLNGKDDVLIRSFKVIVLHGNILEQDLLRIKNYLINPVEMREKDLTRLSREKSSAPQPVSILQDFIHMDTSELTRMLSDMGLAMSFEDLKMIQEYFALEEHRDPTEAEIRVLDTYWSDHCRHTTFETVIDSLTVKEGLLQKKIEAAFQSYLQLREEAQRSHKNMSLMDMATIYGKYMSHAGRLEDLEESEEVNACSIVIDVDENGTTMPWLLMFKNETHNHPTEIEPFGGASTCVGGAIRDPLSGRSYVYQAMRITGAGDITAPIEATLENKLPQSVISKTAARGYSSYGNQIGLATTFVRELYHDNFVAKRMEVGAVVGAAPLHNVLRESPAEGDVVILLGGRTGRDGIGGATGSSKVHTDESLETSSSEVQKGNAPIERRMQRLFRNPQATRLIKKANDFGAGGVSVAIGEIARGIDIDLDKVPLKYEGLSGMEIAISESQERMAVLVAPSDVPLFLELSRKENLEATPVATVTDRDRLVMVHCGDKIVDISRNFLDTNGHQQHMTVEIHSDLSEDPFLRKPEGSSRESFLKNLKDPNVAMQKGMEEMFDSTIGKSTVLMPYGGKYQLTKAEASVQKLPVDSFTTTASIMTYGYQPDVAMASPYLGGLYSVVEALARQTAVGGDYKKARLSCQEYFEKLEKDPLKWGKPAQALLGLIEGQRAFDVPAIGGKDSMSGTFNDIHVPPTLITFAISTEHTDQIISNEFKGEDHYIYFVKHNIHEDYTPNFEELKINFEKVRQLIQKEKIISAGTVQLGGLGEALVKMSLGNAIGLNISTEEDLFSLNIGGLVVEAPQPIDEKGFLLLGKTTSGSLLINGETFTFEELKKAAFERYESLYPTSVSENKTPMLLQPPAPKDIDTVKYKGASIEKPRVLIPVFPGTNCEYDTSAAFRRAGAEVEVLVFNNLTVEDISQSIEALADSLKNAEILSLVGGFSSGDEPDGSGKFIANVLKNKDIQRAILDLQKRRGLILGICNGFQALIKSGLLPYGAFDSLTENSPTLFRNDIDRHVSKIVTTRVVSNSSPWFRGFEIGELHSVAVSHGEGKFVLSEKDALHLFERGQIVTQYSDPEGNATADGLYNPNGAYYAVEGITSEDGLILGKMGHSERYEAGLFKNIPGNKEQDIFKNAVEWCMT